IEKFKGRYLHSRDYKHPQAFADKRVIVIGIGNSGSDLAVEISHTAKQVFLSTRRGAWILNRVGEQGLPEDVVLTTRMNKIISKLMPTSMVCNWVEKRLNTRFNHSHYGLKPKHRILHQHPTVNDDLPNRIISGRVLVKPNVQEFTATAAIFEDGTKEDDIDAVVFATGYSFAFPFLEDCVTVVENQIPLYKYVFPVHLEKPTLAFIGLIQPLGAIMPISELQSRWATRVFKGLEKFKGRYLHSREYKTPQAFSEQRVVVVGTGNSGIDIAVELGHVAKQVFLSTRRGAWVLHRLAESGYPFDYSYLTRLFQTLNSLVPPSIGNFFMERKLNARFDHMLYGLKPQHRVFHQHPSINDDLPNSIIAGRVLVKPNIREFTATAAIFEDGTKEDDIDAVVFATGYSFAFPFLEDCVTVVENQIPLYKYVFPVHLEKPTLAFIGLTSPLGPPRLQG
ncbi:PREDICTED: dimethylaniline monooxygenase [N-oxide-forming] 5-like, partial [Tinamus guttatus]|uniref:dimethylaniline monooxygenase [N-oxide-forming] 5-like n=1 Tax=Tinamus guttatus TaxID=94827 RepID=UPI00052E7E1B